MVNIRIRKVVIILCSIALIYWLYPYTYNLRTYFGSKSAAISKTKPNNKSTGLIKVIARTVELTNNDQTYEAVGTGIAKNSVQIYPAVADQVTKVLFKAQDKVEENSLLVQLDDREEQLAVRLAKVKVKVAASLVNRYEKALKEGGVPESEVEAIHADYEAAKVGLEQAILALNDRKILAPFGGFVGIPNIDPGDRVTTSTLITGLDNREIIFVDFEIPENLAAELSKTESLPISISGTTPAWPNRKFSGSITALESRLDPSRRTITARVSIDNTEDLLRPGMSFAISWQIRGEKYPTIPEIALQWGRDGSYVWIIKDKSANLVPVKIIARENGKILVTGDLKAGDLVVVEGVQRLSPGAHIDLLESTTK